VAYSRPALNLRKPKTIELPRLSDRISYLYIDYAVVSQDRTGVIATQEVNDEVITLHIPVATLGFLLLGPGTSVSTPAMISLHRAGTAVVYTSEGGMSGFAAARPLTGRADWAQAQARCWSSLEYRLAAARTLYARQFRDQEIAPDTPLRVLRGIEGAQVRSLYQTLSKKHRLGNWRRETDPEKFTDPVNPLLNLGSAILYGAALTAVSALGLSTSLGFIHNGAANALLFDLADVHKPYSSIPLAFANAKRSDGSANLRVELRHYLYENNVMEDMLTLLVDILTEHLAPAEGRRDTLIDEGRDVEGHTNYRESVD
jgi:CRISPR-associated protein Cas1